MAIIYQTNFDSDTVGQLPAEWVNRTGTSWLTSNLFPVSGTNSFTAK